MRVTSTPSIRGAGRAQHQDEVDARGLPGRRCDKNRHDTSASLWGRVRYEDTAVVKLSLPLCQRKHSLQGQIKYVNPIFDKFARAEH